MDTQKTRCKNTPDSSEVLRYFVEIRGFEPLQTEPKSVVLPLHHISIPGAKIQNISEIQAAG